MLMFLAGLQNINEEVREASEIDGATAWQRFRLVTLPMLRPTLILVLTLGLISTWQVFDQIYLTGNNPATIDPGLPVLQPELPELGVRDRRGDRVPAVRADHRARRAAAAARRAPGRTSDVRARPLLAAMAARSRLRRC